MATLFFTVFIFTLIIYGLLMGMPTVIFSLGVTGFLIGFLAIIIGFLLFLYLL